MKTISEITALVLLCHLVGDYLIQSHWMANTKTTSWWVAILHGVTYTLPFLIITQRPLPLFVIACTHIYIDHYRLARYVVWFRNQLAPSPHRFPITKTGSPNEAPDYISVWLLFIADNILHILINIGAIVWL